MYYLTKILLGNEQCIDESPTDIYTDCMPINCDISKSLPPPVIFVRSLKVKCSGAEGLLDAKVYKNQPL